MNLYAYSSHAEPPSFKLHPRVFVQLIPYEFQNIAFGPSFIKLWSNKAKRFGLYDYFKYTDTQYDLPGGLTIEQAMKRLIHSVKSGSEGTSFETSYSKFSSGIPLWVMSRYMADGDPNWENNLKILVNDLYKYSAAPIEKLFSLFYLQPEFNQNYLGNAVKLIEQAASGSKNDIVKQRINELKQYMHFVHLVYQSRNEKTGSLMNRLIPLAEYAWKIYESGIIHSYRIMQLVSYGFLKITQDKPEWSSYQKLHNYWFPETTRSKSAWNRIRQGLDDSQTENNFKLLQKIYPQTFDQSFSSFNEIENELKSKYVPSKRFVIGGASFNRGYFGISHQKPVRVSIRHKLTETSDPKITLSIIDKNYSDPKAFVLTRPEGKLDFEIPAGENTVFINATGKTVYRLEVSINDGLIFFDGSPRMIQAFYRNFTDPRPENTYDPNYYPSHIFIPSHTKILDYQVQLNQLRILTASGKKVESTLIHEEGGTEIRRINVHPQESGKIWKAIITGNYNYRFLNIPDRYYLLKEK